MHAQRYICTSAVIYACMHAHTYSHTWIKRYRDSETHRCIYRYSSRHTHTHTHTQSQMHALTRTYTQGTRLRPSRWCAREQEGVVSVPLRGRTVRAPACLLTAAKIGEPLLQACMHSHIRVCARPSGDVFRPRWRHVLSHDDAVTNRGSTSHHGRVLCI